MAEAYFFNPYSTLTKPPSKSNTWRLNSTLLTDPVLLLKISLLIKEFFEHNVTPGVDPMMIWESHKCTIRGELIWIGAQRKIEQEKEIKQLVNKIHTLETQHKQSLTE